MDIGWELQMIMWRDKMSKYIYTLFILSLLGCTGKDTLVRPHEQKKDDPKTYSLLPRNTGVGELSVDKMYEFLEKPSSSSEMILEQILNPLEIKMINENYISDPENTAGDFAIYLNLYTDALLKVLKMDAGRGKSLAMLDRFVNLTLKNCDESLVDCTKVKVFRTSSKSSQLVVLKANQIGNQIDACVERSEISKCTSLIEKKYYLLFHAKNLKVIADPNLEFITSYLEHASLVEKLPGSSFARRNHSAIFSTVVQFFNPEQTSIETRCKVIKNFDVWKYSRLSLFGSRQQMIKLFELASSCDLYDRKNQLTESFQRAQLDLQMSEAAGGLTFFKRFQEINRNEADRQLFLKYLNQNLLDRATTLDKNGLLDSSFYDEYFFVLDRLYNGHIGTEEASVILFKAKRSYRKLIVAFNNYIRMQLVASIIDTKKYFSDLLNQDYETVGSDRIFTNAIENSDSFAETWRTKKSRFEDLFKAVRSVFQAPGLTTPLEKKSYEELKLQVRFLPSTIKFIATYPTMMSLAHFVAVQESEKKARAWWGGEIKYSASTIYEEMWKGLERPWVNFSAESEPLNKFYLVYAFDYAIRSDFVSVQREEDAKLSSDQKLESYSRILVQRYFKSERDALETMYKSSFLPSVDAEKLSTQKKQICEYELNPKAQEIPVLNKNLADLRAQLHSGVGRKAPTNYALSSINYFNIAKDMLVQINDKTSVKLQMMKAFIEVMKRNQLPATAINEAQVEFDKINEFVNRRLDQFAVDYKFHTNCLLRLYLVESYYQYLAFESEKKYLADTWERMAKLRTVPAEKKQEEIKKINDLEGIYADTESKKNNNNVDLVNFDKIIDEKTFLYSRFDILVRLKKLMMSGQIHDYKNAKISEVVADWAEQFPGAMAKPMELTRDWNISAPPVLEQSDLLNNRDYDIQVYWSASKDVFVNNGLKALSGVDNNSFLSWWSDENNNDLTVWKTALENLIYIYILQKNSLSNVNRIKADDLISHMKMILNLISINNVDKELIKSFGYSAKFKVDKNLKDLVVDGGLRETLFPHSFLYDNFKTKIGMNSELLDPEQVKKSSSQGAIFADAYILSLNLNDQQYRIYFTSHEWLEPYLRGQYEEISKDRLQKIQDMAEAFSRNRNYDDAGIIFRLDKDDRGNLKSISIKDFSRIPVENNLIHPDRLIDMNKFINKFTLKTNNIYNTSNLGKGKDK